MNAHYTSLQLSPSQELDSVLGWNELVVITGHVKLQACIFTLADLSVEVEVGV